MSNDAESGQEEKIYGCAAMNAAMDKLAGEASLGEKAGALVNDLPKGAIECAVQKAAGAAVGAVADNGAGATIQNYNKRPMP